MRWFFLLEIKEMYKTDITLFYFEPWVIIGAGITVVLLKDKVGEGKTLSVRDVLLVWEIRVSILAST